MHVAGYNEADAKEYQGFDRPQAGAYVLKIISSTEDISKAGNPMIVLDLDIAEGEFANFYKSIAKPEYKWPCRYYQLVGEDNISYYKGVIKAIRESNLQNFPAKAFEGEDHEISQLKGLFVGGMLREEEYFDKNGNVRSNLKPMFLCSTETALSGKLTIPKRKTVATEEQKPAQADGDLPW